MQEIKYKESAMLTTEHYSLPMARIVLTVARFWPLGEYMMVTRGTEEVSGGSPTSKHLEGQAFDFRTRHLPSEISRQNLLDKIMGVLGSDYYGYYKRYEREDGYIVEWIHIQWNGIKGR